MKPIYEIDFSVLNENEKVEFMYDLYDSMEAGFQEIQFPIQLLAQTLIFTRWWNSYKYMAPNEPTPQILETAIELLWDFQEEKCDPKTFARFQKSLSDSALEILTGDDSELNADSESEAFYQRHFQQWDAMSYEVFLSNLCTVLEEAVSQEITWDAVEGVVDGDIGDTMIDFFETVYKNDSNGYYPSEEDHAERYINKPNKIKAFRNSVTAWSEVHNKNLQGKLNMEQYIGEGIAERSPFLIWKRRISDYDEFNKI